MINDNDKQQDEIAQLKDLFVDLRVRLRNAEDRLHTLDHNNDVDVPKDRHGRNICLGDKVAFSATKVTRRGTGTVSRFASNFTRVFIRRTNTDEELQRAPHNVLVITDKEHTQDGNHQ